MESRGGRLEVEASAFETKYSEVWMKESSIGKPLYIP